jgi:glycosyltransferase involved in cell wall biosynthesis
MVCGLPVVAFDCPWGPRNIISDGEDGLLVENGNVDAFAAVLSKIMEDEKLRHSMATAGLKNVQRFKLVQIAEQWKSLFDSL